MGYFVDPLGNYYEHDRAHALDQEVPKRPGQFYIWSGLQWVYTPPPPDNAGAARQMQKDALRQELDNKIATMSGVSKEVMRGFLTLLDTETK